MYLEFESCIQVNEKLFFIPYGRSMFCYNLNDETTTCISTSNCAFDEEYVTGEIYRILNKLIWFAQDGTYMGMYDFSNNEMVKMFLPKITYKNWCSIIICGIIEENIYIVPKYDHKIIKYNFKDNQFCQIDIDYDKNVDDNGIDSACIVDKKLIGISKSTRRLFVVDLVASKVEFFYDLSCVNVSSCYTYNNSFFFLSNNGVWQFDIAEKKFKNIYECNEISGLLIVERDKIFVFPHSKDEILEINRNTNICEMHMNYPIDFKYNNKEWSKYCRYSYSAEYIWLSSRCANYMARINRDKQAIEWVASPKVYGIEEMILDFKNKNVISENDEKGLDLFIKLVTDM